MKTSLKALAASLERVRGTGRAVFFRDDDVDNDETSLGALLGVFALHSAPLNLAVIPGLLTESGAEYLREYRDSNPGMVEFLQHGWKHCNHEKSGRKCEFGPSREFGEQLGDIASGLDAMRREFGNDLSPAFVPPWNRCTGTTFNALIQLGFECFSGKAGNALPAGLRDLSVNVDIFEWHEGAKLRPAEVITQELAYQLETRETVGVMLHHKVMDATAFELVDGILAVLRPVVRIQTLDQVLRAT